MEAGEAYSDEKLVEEISASLLQILKNSPRSELMDRCLEKSGVEDKDELKEMIEKRLRIIFRKPPKKKKKPVAAESPSDTSLKKPGENGEKKEEEEEDEEEEWHTSDDEFNMSYEDTDFDERGFHSDSEVTIPPTSMMDPHGKDDFDSPSNYGTPPKMPRLDKQDLISSGDWSSDGTDTRTLEPSNDHMNGSGSSPIRPVSPAPLTVSIPTARRILGELPLEKDEFDSSSDDDGHRPHSSNIGMESRIHPPSILYPTATVNETTGNSLDGSSLELPLDPMPQDENDPGIGVGMAQSLPPSSLFSPPIGASSSQPPDILANRDLSPSIPTVSSSLPNPSTIPYVLDDPEFDSDGD